MGGTALIRMLRRRGGSRSDCHNGATHNLSRRSSRSDCENGEAIR